MLNFPLDTKQVILQMLFPANLLASTDYVFRFTASTSIFDIVFY